MHHQSTATSCAAAHRRRATALAIAALFAASGAVQAFDIDTGNPDFQMRWDNTLRYNLGARVQSQDSKIIGSPNYDDGDRNFDKGSLVTNRVDVLSEFDFVYKRQMGFRVSGAGWYDNAYSHLDNTNNATANTLVNGLPVAGVLSDYTKRYAKGVSGELLDAFAFANFDARRRAGQHQGRPAYRVLGRQPAARRRDPRRVVRTEPARRLEGLCDSGSEAKELFRPRGGITAQAQPLKELSIAGQWFYNWQADRIPESGSYLTIQDPLNFGGDSFIFGPNPLAAVIPGAPAFLRLWRGQDIKPPSNSGSLGDWGVSARWSPDWLDGTLGFYYRNATDVFPQAMVTPGVAPVPAAVCSARGGVPLPGGTLCFVNPRATRLPDLQRFGKLGLYNGAYGDNIHFYGVTLAKSIAGVSVGAEVSYRQNMPLAERPGPGAPRRIRAARSRVRSRRRRCRRRARPARSATRGTGSSTPSTSSRGPRCSTPQSSRASSPGCSGRRSRRTRRCSRGAATTRRSTRRRRTSSVSRSTSRRRGSRSSGVDLLAPVTWSQGISGNAAVLFGGSEGGGNWSAGIAADIYQKYRIDLKYNGYYGDYSTNPTAATPAGGVLGVPNGANSSLSDRGWVSLTLKTTF